jgi:hypothetical protein
MSTYETWFFYRQLIHEEENRTGEDIIPTFICNVYINSCNLLSSITTLSIQEKLKLKSEVKKNLHEKY